MNCLQCGEKLNFLDEHETDETYPHDTLTTLYCDVCESMVLCYHNHKPSLQSIN